MPPPDVIFAPGRSPAVLVGLHTADHIGGASPVQEAEGAPAAGHRTCIMGFPVGEQEATIALRFVHHRRGVFSALLYVLHSRMPSLGWGRQHQGAGPAQASLTFSAAWSVFFWTFSAPRAAVALPLSTARTAASLPFSAACFAVPAASLIPCFIFSVVFAIGVLLV